MKLLEKSTSKILLSTVKMNSLLKRLFIQEYDYPEKAVDEIPHPCQQVEGQTDLSQAQLKLGLDNRQVILMFGYVRKGKGLEIAQEAMAKIKKEVPNALLLVAGKAQDQKSRIYLAQLKNQGVKLGVEDVFRYDSHYIPNDQVPLYFSAASIILVPYTESVGASGPIHNYAGYGRPIIASDVGYHMREALGGTLTLFKTGDSEDLANKVVTLLKNDGLRQKLSIRQCNYVESETWDEAAKRTIRHYASVIFRK
jgi:glycosyltransferase involved in cell wall biosynthesis